MRVDMGLKDARQRCNKHGRQVVKVGVTVGVVDMQDNVQDMRVDMKVTGVRKRRQAAGKWTIGEKLTAAGRKRAAARKQKREATKMNEPMKRAQTGKAAKGTGIVSTAKSRAKAIGAKAGTKVRRKAVKTVYSKPGTKGGDYVKYEKGSKAAKSFRSTFKSKCAGGAKSFTWDGRSYSCKKK